MPRFGELRLVLILKHIYCGITGKSCVRVHSFSGFVGGEGEGTVGLSGAPGAPQRRKGSVAGWLEF